MSMIPRSYDQRVKTDVHPRGFKLSSNSTGYFGPANPEKDTAMGRQRLERSLAEFKEHCAQHKAAEDYAVANKRQLMVEKHELNPRWAQTKNQGA